MTRQALVLTVSDGVSAGTREDLSGAALDDLLSASGFSVTRSVVPDNATKIEAALRIGVESADLIVTTGGTGFGPRDVTPEATARVIEKDAPALVQLMTSQGLKSTPMAALSRGRAGSTATTLILNVPGSPRGALESVEAVLEVVPHALDLLAGDTEHQ